MTISIVATKRYDRKLTKHERRFGRDPADRLFAFLESAPPRRSRPLELLLWLLLCAFPPPFSAA